MPSPPVTSHPLEAQVIRSDAEAREPEAAEPDRAKPARALHEFQAAQARVERVLGETRSKPVADLLPVLDGLDRTIRAAADARTASAQMQGVRLVRAQLLTVLQGYGVERIESLDAPFDPSIHEVVGVAPVTILHARRLSTKSSRATDSARDCCGRPRSWSVKPLPLNIRGTGCGTCRSA